MGKRKKTLRGSLKNKKKIGPLPTRFSCPECKHENVVSCKVFKKDGIGVAVCKVCEAKHECLASALTKPIDIYSDWVDKSDRF
ncbi:hypothetical protein EDEG_03130 [Edhazardia aedis USNM 41457]|uniref:Transcription elongation factor 1 homolog n=1 Tax=Edhazardia aedis (strain USNM 41457) TaxID=1003232 RepID=J9DM47_EDHAE|nr:hypothetical protein EDEG_03130 [Edhazardia aedis USNM 41457]|eukprot:EJW02457.1 hypothetical protein EDEG_03130 [Edhazardia aedis USNM 41457]